MEVNGVVLGIKFFKQCIFGHFAAYCAANADSNGAMKIVKMLNTLYTKFDDLTDPKLNPNIYKVRQLNVIGAI